MTQSAIKLVHSVEKVAPNALQAATAYEATTAELAEHVSRAWRESGAKIKRACFRLVTAD